MSVQGQFAAAETFERVLSELNQARISHGPLTRNFHTDRSFAERLVRPGLSVRNAIQGSRNRDLRVALLAWLQRSGTFIDEDRIEEEDDYFEFCDVEVTNGALGEAARRVKCNDQVITFSFMGGHLCFEVDPLEIDHGLREGRLGRYAVSNVWTIRSLEQSALNEAAEILSWRMLVDAARERFPHLILPGSIYERPALAREPFSEVIRDQALRLLSYLDAYMEGRARDGSENPKAQSIIREYFRGDRALFVPESLSNRRKFETELSFPDPSVSNRTILAHYHGRISRNFFRLHFEWPVPRDLLRLKVLYLGPKITKD